LTKLIPAVAGGGGGAFGSCLGGIEIPVDVKPRPRPLCV